jgi:hypothetical protein
MATVAVMAYTSNDLCGLLLDNITRTNGGYTTLRLINDVRNDLGRATPTSGGAVRLALITSNGSNPVGHGTTLYTPWTVTGTGRILALIQSLAAARVSKGGTVLTAPTVIQVVAICGAVVYTLSFVLA